MFVMVFVVEIIRISVMVSIVFVSRVTMGFVMLFAINATGLLQYCEICDCLYCSCGGPIWEKIQGRFLLPVRPWTHPSICLSIHLSIHLYLPTVCLSAFLSNYVLWRLVGCPLIISITPSLNRRPSPGSRREWVCEKGGALKQPWLAACNGAHLKWMEPHHRPC